MLGSITGWLGMPGSEVLPPSKSQLALADVLSGERQESNAPTANGTSLEDAGESLEHKLYEEHTARLKAEAAEEHAVRRLTVAQEQLVEYAQQQAADTAAVLAEAQALEGLLASAAAGRPSSPSEAPLASAAQPADRVDSAAGRSAANADDMRGGSSDGGSGGGDGNGAVAQLRSCMALLRQRLLNIAGEADTFAAQQKADLARSKRSLSQAQLAGPNDDDVDMKRQRDTPDPSTEAEHAEGDDMEMGEEAHTSDPSPAAAAAAAAAASFTERARYIPMRLSTDERRLLRLLEAALSVSEYTDKVDISTWKAKDGRVRQQIRDICSILCGLVVAMDYRKGQKLITDRDFKANAEFFQDVFEVGRRYKIMNPDKMRSEYGKLVYLLMDSADGNIQELIEFRCVRPLRTVYTTLEEGGALKMLLEPLMATATAEIIAGERPRSEIQRDIKAKERARDLLAQKYKSSKLSGGDILSALYSFSDNNSFLLFNRDPLDRAIGYLQEYFSPDMEGGLSLAISGGRGGARLTHSHQRQYAYVLQSLSLWREINTDMFKLWCLAEADLLSESSPYRLVNTGQGMNRVQQAPGVSKAIHAILWRCQQRIGSWVGSAVVHLGDHNVPNALMFIDKYQQVPRILNPLVLVLDSLPALCRDPKLAAYVHSVWGGVEQCRKAILVDFFRHAFDGSGADNFFDAGSCIDGRLTSAWNWCSKIEKKDYYPVFKLAGFHSFDGDFQK